MRHLLNGLLEADAPVTIVDMEAGLEHLSRGTARHVDVLLVTLEPYFKALETARRAAELGRELGIARVLGIANKLRHAGDTDAVRAYAAAHGIELAAQIPFDDDMRDAELEGKPPIDVPGSAAVKEIGRLADALLGVTSSPVS